VFEYEEGLESGVLFTRPCVFLLCFLGKQVFFANYCITPSSVHTRQAHTNTHTDSHLLTHLQAAVEGNQPEAATWLLRRWAAHFGVAQMHALMDQRTLAGYSAMWWCGMDGRESVARVLLAYGMDDRAFDRNQVSCLDIARKRRKHGVLALYAEAERAYFLSRVRSLAEVGRAVGPEAEEGEHGEDEKAQDGGAVDDREKVEAVAAFVMRDLASDLAMELGLWMR